MISVEKPKYMRRFTLVLGFTRTDYFFGGLVDGSCTSALFYDFIKNMPSKINQRSYVALVDSATVHRTPLVAHMAHNKDLNLIFPPPYYPQAFPIELRFA